MEHEHLPLVWKPNREFLRVLHFKEFQWVLTSKKGAREHAPLLAEGEGGTVWEGCTCCMCTHTSYRTLRCHGVKCTLLDRFCLREFRFKFPRARSDSHYGSINPPPSLHSHVLDSTAEANSTNRQQCLAGAEGKLVREVKVNNIPCCLQWARDFWAAFSVSLKRKRKRREGSVQISDFKRNVSVWTRSLFNLKKMVGEGEKLESKDLKHDMDPAHKHGSHNRADKTRLLYHLLTTLTTWSHVTRKPTEN